MKSNKLFTSSLINSYKYIIIYMLIAGGITPGFFCQTFSNTNRITFSNNSIASLYPSSISVSGIIGTISSLTVTLKGFSSSAPSNLDMLLVGALGQKFIIMNAAGGTNDVSNVNLTFSDAGSSFPLFLSSSGTYKPTANSLSADFASPAPGGPYNYPENIGSSTLSSTFAGTDPNGTWDLYVWDNGTGAGSIAGGWSLNFIITLPVELTSFTGFANNNVVNLIWNTATEVNNYGFEIERQMTNDKNGHSSLVNGLWGAIGFVKGNGNSNSPKNYSFTDNSNLSPGKYSYRLKQIDNDGKFEYSKVIDVAFNAPKEFSLNQNYPNPFNPATTISYSIPKAEHVTLKVYDELGKEVSSLVDENKEAGNYMVQFNGQQTTSSKQLSSGIYFYRLTAGDFTDVKKLMLLK